MDPPYGFQDTLSMSDVKRGAQANYSTMTNKELLSLPIKELADPDWSVLALWCPSSLLDFGLELMKEYSFDFKQIWIWCKIKNDPFKKMKKLNKKGKLDFDNVNWNDFLSFGMGHLARNMHEVVLIGTKGKVYKELKNRSQRTVFFAPNEKHSKKPEILQDKLELMFNGNNVKKIEVFARRQRLGWTTIGNQNPSTINEDIRISLSKLVNYSVIK